MEKPGRRSHSPREDVAGTERSGPEAPVNSRPHRPVLKELSSKGSTRADAFAVLSAECELLSAKYGDRLPTTVRLRLFRHCPLPTDHWPPPTDH
jgi:hypothetical protein